MNSPICVVWFLFWHLHLCLVINEVAKWAIELGSHGLKYVTRTTIKSQALVDFINDWTEMQMPEEKPDSTYWTIHFDGSKQLEGSGAGVVLTSPRGDKFCYVLRGTYFNPSDPSSIAHLATRPVASLF